MLSLPSRSPHTLGVSLVHNPYTADAEVIFTALYLNVGGPLHAISTLHPHYILSPMTGRMVPLLEPVQLARLSGNLAGLYDDHLVLFVGMLRFATMVGSRGYQIFAAFGQRGQVPFGLHDDVVGCLPGAPPDRAALFGQPYRLFNISPLDSEEGCPSLLPPNGEAGWGRLGTPL